MKWSRLSVPFLLVLCSFSPLLSQIPRAISYQGVLSDSTGTPRPDGVYLMTFRLYTSSSSGSSLWSEAKTLQVKRGLFSTVLGDLATFPDSLKFDRQYWLGLQIGADPELSPRMPLTAAGYSINSLKADTARYSLNAPPFAVADSARITGTVPDNSITSQKIAPAQVVKSLNNLKDGVTLRAQGGATITSSNDTITINSGAGGGGTGIQGIQNTNNTLDILNPGGPTATVNLKVPLNLDGSSSSWIFSARNTAPGSAATFVTTSPNWGGVAVDVEALGSPNSGLAAVAYGTGTALIAQNTASGNAINASSSKGTAVYATSAGGPAVYAIGTGAFGVQATSDVSFGVLGQSNSGIGVYASSNSSIGLDASSVSDYAIVGQTTNGYAGVHGAGGHNGVFGETNSATDAGVFGRNNGTSNGVFGFSAGGNGVDGFTQTGYAAVHGFGGHNGVFGETNSSTDAGVFARNNGAGNGVYGRSVSGTGVYGFSESGYAGVFDGRVAVHVLQINGGSDVAEPFSIDGDETAAPGTVVIIDDQNPGKLKVSQSAYDHRVAGIVSGAGGIQPGVTLQQDNLATGTTMVAIAGRVYTRAEALSEPIMPGDLLTTSGETGCAMKATDKDRSRGAIIGKAMSSLRGGTGLVLVLVNLQ